MLVGILWIQELVDKDDVAIQKVLGVNNVADVPTKIVPSCLTSTELALWQAFAGLPKIFEKGEL